MKKLLSVLFAAVLTAGVFTGCSKDDEGNVPNETWNDDENVLNETWIIGNWIYEEYDEYGDYFGLLCTFNQNGSFILKEREYSYQIYSGHYTYDTRNKILTLRFYDDDETNTFTIFNASKNKFSIMLDESPAVFTRTELTELPKL